MARLSDSIAVTASVLKKGQPAIFPTETVYGLGVSIRHAASPDILYSLKRREKAKPISWLVSQQNDLARFGRCVPEFAFVLARTFWPAPDADRQSVRRGTRGGVSLEHRHDRTSHAEQRLRARARSTRWGALLQRPRQTYRESAQRPPSATSTRAFAPRFPRCFRTGKTAPRVASPQRSSTARRTIRDRARRCHHHRGHQVTFVGLPVRARGFPAILRCDGKIALA